MNADEVALILSRMQFAANITFHILFPTISIGLGWVMFWLRLKHVRTGEAKHAAAHLYWTKVFALTFAMGVVSGITMSFQFGTNWPGYMNTVGNIAGPLLGYEVLTAFFLEATFLGVMLFGRERVSPRMHLVATLLVAVGTSLSAFWILSLNSWMQTPTGYTFEDGQVIAADWLAVVFNPSFPYRLVHMVLASGVTVAFLLAGTAALQMRKGSEQPWTRDVLRTGVRLAALLVPLQIFAGDLHGLNTLQHQPAKVAAMEALWETQRGAPLVLFAIPDAETRSNKYAIEIPKGASLILKHELDGELQGIDAFPDHPPVAPVFFAFRIMVGMGLLMLVVAWVSAWTLRRARKAGTPPPENVLRVLSWMTFSGWVATVAGWYVSEVGRQPWLVTGLLRTADAVAPHPPGMVGLTFALYVATYVLLVIAYVKVLRHLALTTKQKPARDPIAPAPLDEARP